MHDPSPGRPTAAPGRRRSPVLRVIRWFGTLMAAGVVAFALTVLAVLLLAWPKVEDAGTPPVAPLVIVLGAGMAADGTLGANTIRRFEDGLALIAEGRADRIHFSGGDMHRGITEGALMAEIAAARFPEATITYEDRSRSTLQNAWFSMEALGPLPAGTLLVTDAVHLFRGWASFQWAGGRGLVLVQSLRLDEIAPAERPRRVLSEALAVWLNAGRAAVFSARRMLGAEPEAIVGLLAGGGG